MRSSNDQVRRHRPVEDRVDGRFVDDDGFDAVRRGLGGEPGQVIGGGRLCHAPLGLQSRDLFEREVRRWLEPLGMQHAEPCAKGRRHHSADGQRAGRRVPEVYGHEYRLRRTLPMDRR